MKLPKFKFSGQSNFYRGKVRDVYTIGDKLVMVASDRISAFDVILPKTIPYKGQVLNLTAQYFLNATRDVCPNWLIAVPDNNVSIGYNCQPFRIEMVIRGYLTGHAWRTYKSGKRILCGVNLAERMIENQKFETPIITPSTKSDVGHDEDISKEEIIARGLATAEQYAQLEKYTHALFQRGTEMAAARGLILVDTKYEFGVRDGKIILIDEVHTPDSSRYYHAEGFDALVKARQKPQQLSKEFVREWLIENNFQGLAGQQIPEMKTAWVKQISERYINLYETVTGKSFEKISSLGATQRIYVNVEKCLKGLNEI